MFFALNHSRGGGGGAPAQAPNGGLLVSQPSSARPPPRSLLWWAGGRHLEGNFSSSSFRPRSQKSDVKHQRKLSFCVCSCALLVGLRTIDSYEGREGEIATADCGKG